jgi:excisionase family DNA binding protein
MTGGTEYLRAGDIARLMGVAVRTVRRWIAEEILPSVKVRGMRLVLNPAASCCSFSQAQSTFSRAVRL